MSVYDPQTWGFQSQAGPGKQTNEDGWFIPDDLEITGQPAQAPALVAAYGALFVVADGARSGTGIEQAGRHIAERLARAFYRSPNSNREVALKEAVKAANASLASQARPYQDKDSAVVAAVVQDTRLIVAHVGDSRAYLLRSGKLVPLTHDHSWRQARLDSGEMSIEQIERHPYRDRLTRALGRNVQVEVEVVSVSLTYQDDALLLCSDGLTDVVPESVIEEALRSLAPQEAANWLIECAANSGCKDDVTAVVVAIAAQHAPVLQSTASHDWTTLFALFLVVAAAVGLNVITSRSDSSPFQATTAAPTPAPPPATGTGDDQDPGERGGQVSEAGVTPPAGPPTPTAARVLIPAAPVPGSGGLIASGGTRGGEWQLVGARCQMVTVFFVDGPARWQQTPYYELRDLQDENAPFVYEMFIEATQSETLANSVDCTGELRGGSVVVQGERNGGVVLVVTRPKEVTKMEVDYNPPYGEPSASPVWRLILE